MSDNREADHYRRLHETHHQVAEEEKRRQLEAEAAERNSPEAQLADLQADLAAKVRAGRISPSEMIYRLHRFDNELVGAMNVEDQRQAREEQGVPLYELSQSQNADRQSEQTNAEKEAESGEHEADGLYEMTDSRAARLARLRDIHESIEREARDDDGNEPSRSDGFGLSR